jgi:hypothetical protein
MLNFLIIFRTGVTAHFYRLLTEVVELIQTILFCQTMNSGFACSTKHHTDFSTYLFSVKYDWLNLGLFKEGCIISYTKYIAAYEKLD